jgi:alpha-galactosidase
MKATGSRKQARLKAGLTTLIVASFVLQSFAAPPTSAELKLRRQWVAQHFETKAGALPFSFTYGGHTATELLPAWKLERASAKRQPGRVQRTLTSTDPVTGLRIRCDLTEYDGFPAVEWVLHFENRGTQDTPILEKILPLDAEFKTAAQANVVVHHSLGEKNSGQSFAPVEDVLAPEGSKELDFAPVGGRSSDGQMPFFNLAGQDGGVVMAVGWSGQWEARFHRPARDALAAQAGQQLVHCKLHPGESIRTPRILLVFWAGSAQGGFKNRGGDGSSPRLAAQS